MKRFKFRLERVLQYRNVLRDEKKRELVKRNMLLKDAEEVLEALEQRALQDDLSADVEISAAEVALAGMYREWLKTAIDNQRLTIMQLEEAVEEALRAYVEATQESRTLERVKERKRSEYSEYVEKESGKFLDELTVQKGNTMKRETT